VGFSSRSNLRLDISVYDRTPSLTRSELAAMERIRRSGNPGWALARQRADLLRLIEPLETARSIICSDLKKAPRRQYPLAAIFVTMRKKKKSFWAWSQTDWQDLLSIEEEYRYQIPATMAYLLCNLEVTPIGKKLVPQLLAEKVFGHDMAEAVATMQAALAEWGYKPRTLNEILGMLRKVLLANHSPYLKDISADLLQSHYNAARTETARYLLSTISMILATKGIVAQQISAPPGQGARMIEAAHNGCEWTALAENQRLDSDWLHWCWRWFNTSTFVRQTRLCSYSRLKAIGRWLKIEHPDIVSPAQWDVPLAAECVAMIDRLVIGHLAEQRHNPAGKPLTPATKEGYLTTLRAFFWDCQEWDWIPRRFNPSRAFRTPRSIKSLLGTKPRPVADSFWAKLLWAGLNLRAEDLPRKASATHEYYPFELVRALAVAWLLAGLRSNEYRRLRVGCIRRDPDLNDMNANILPTEHAGNPKRTEPSLSKSQSCLLEVPVNKTAPAFLKPVDHAVGVAIELWEKIRPPQPAVLDKKTGEMVQLLFSYRGRHLGASYVNKTLILMLCRKAGIPKLDPKGAITSHRARSTLASQLYKADMSLPDIQAWLGHKSPASTQYYIAQQPTKLAKAYAEAESFKRNLRSIEVLIDAEAVRNGSTASGESWRYYDLGHGYCTWDFFVECPHRMACAKCDYYLPKASSKAQILEAKSNLLRMRQEIPLTEEECQAVDEGLGALQKLCEKLSNVPTPSGQTPRELVQLTGTLE
jgi:hypothetical protein